MKNKSDVKVLCKNSVTLLKKKTSSQKNISIIKEDFGVNNWYNDIIHDQYYNLLFLALNSLFK